MDLSQICSTIYSLWINTSCWKTKPVCKYWSVIFHKEYQCMMGTDPSYLCINVNLFCPHQALFWDDKQTYSRLLDYWLSAVKHGLWLIMWSDTKGWCHIVFWTLQTTSLWGPREQDFEERTEYCTTTEAADGNERGKWEKTSGWRE